MWPAHTSSMFAICTRWPYVGHPPPGVLGRLLRDERRKARAELLKAMVDDRDPYARLVAKEMILTAEET